MAIDMSKIRQRLNDMQGKTKRTEVMWKPKAGENTIRILPLKSNPDDPFIQLYFHYFNQKSYLSPQSFGDPDPIAEFCESLRAGGNLPKEEWIETKKFQPKPRTFVAVIDRAEPEAGVRFWAFGKTVYNDLLTTMDDEEYGDITDPKTGRDIKVIFTPKEKSDTGFPKTSIRVGANAKPLTTDPAQLKDWLTNQPDIFEIYPKQSYADLRALLDKIVNGTATETASEPTPRTVVQQDDGEWGADVVSPSVAKSAGKQVAQDVDDEFSKLFGK